MDSLRLHTVFMDIREIRKIKYPLIYDFIADQLLLTPSDVQAIQIDLTEGKVYIELLSKHMVQHIIEKYDGKKELICDGKPHKIRLFIEDGGIDVKLHHIPPRMPLEWITQHMQRFGNIINTTDEMCKSTKFPNTLSGVKIVRMQLRRAIPSYISIRGYNTYVTYDNQVQTCRHCGNIMHKGRGCAENRARLAAEERLVTSYADVVSNASPNNTPTQISSTEGTSTVEGGKAQQTASDLVHLGMTGAQPLYNKRAAVNTDESSRKEKSAKTGIEDQPLSTDQRTGGIAATIGNRHGTHSNPPLSTTTSNKSNDAIEMIVDEPEILSRGRSGRSITRTQTMCRSRDASRTIFNQK